MQRENGTLVGRRELRAAGSVLVSPSKGRDEKIEHVAPLIRAAGYRGGRGHAKSTKRGEQFPAFGDFWKDRLSSTRLRGERRNLERLATALKRAR